MFRFFCLVFLGLLPIISEAQNYVPFPTDSARWKVTYYSGALGCPSMVAEYQYEITGDTVISSQVYQKISRVGYTNNIFCYPEAWDYVGCIREDGNKHIFFRPPNARFDTLLYDFNLSVGDTVVGVLNCNCSDVITVLSIDSVMVGSAYRKRFNLDGFACGANGYSLIEGIGSTTGLLDCISSFEAAGFLDCFALNGQSVYPDTTTTCPLLIESVVETETTIWSAFPNPAHEEVVIATIPTGTLQPQLISIFDITGQLVRQEIMTPRENGCVIEKSGLNSDVYFVEIAGKDGTVSRIKIAFL